MPFIAIPIGIAITNAALGAGLGSLAWTLGPLLANAAVYGGLAAASQIASSALQRSITPDLPNAASPLATLNSPAQKVNVKQATPFQRIIRGRQRTGGPICFYKATAGAGAQSKLVVQHLYSARKITGIAGVNLNGNKLSFGASPAFGSILVPTGIDGQPDYPGHVRACFQSGTVDQPTNPLLRALWPDLPEGWRLPGIANAVYEYEFGADYDAHTLLYGNVRLPETEPEIDGCSAYDPRDPTQWLPSNPDDIFEWFAAQESWKPTYNAALHQADHLWQPDGLDAGADGVRWDKVAEAADRCDEAAATRNTEETGQFERRYEIHGVIGMDQKSADVLDGMLTASRATLVQGYDGRAWPSHDAPKRSVFTIRDDMIIGDVSFRGWKVMGDLANRTTMEFVAPARKYQMSEGPPYIRADLQLEDGQELSLNVNLPYTASPSMAQRIAKADLLDVRVEASWAGVIDLRGLGLREDDCIEIISEICPHWNGLYVVDDGNVTINLRGESGLALRLIGYVPENANNWNATSDDQPHEVVDTDELLAA